MSAMAARISAKHATRRLEGIDPLLADDLFQRRFADGLYDKINFDAFKGLVQNLLHGAKIHKVQSATLGRRDHDIDVAADLGFVPRH